MHSCWVPFGTMRACIAVSRQFIEFRSRHTPTQTQSRFHSRSSTNIDCAYKCKWKVLLVLVNHIFLFVNIFFCHFKSASSFVLFLSNRKTLFAYKYSHCKQKHTYNYTNATQCRKICAPFFMLFHHYCVVS